MQEQHAKAIEELRTTRKPLVAAGWPNAVKVSYVELRRLLTNYNKAEERLKQMRASIFTDRRK